MSAHSARESAEFAIVAVFMGEGFRRLNIPASERVVWIAGLCRRFILATDISIRAARPLPPKLGASSQSQHGAVALFLPPFYPLLIAIASNRSETRHTPTIETRNLSIAYSERRTLCQPVLKRNSCERIGNKAARKLLRSRFRKNNFRFRREMNFTFFVSFTIVSSNLKTIVSPQFTI